MLAPSLQKGREHSAQDQSRATIVDSLEARLEPVADRVLVQIEEHCDLLHQVISMELYAAVIEPLHLRQAPRQVGARILPRLLTHLALPPLMMARV
jgi:hypothetical protein